MIKSVSVALRFIRSSRGLGCKTSGGRLLCTERSGTETFPNKQKCAGYIPGHCLPILYRIQYKSGYTEKIVIPNSLPEPNLLRTSFQEFGITFLSLAVFPIQKCFEYH